MIHLCFQSPDPLLFLFRLSNFITELLEMQIKQSCYPSARDSSTYHLNHILGQQK